MLKFVKVFGLVALVVLVCTSTAMAASGDTSVFDTVVGKGRELFKEIRTVVFVLGGFGLVGLAVASIFGRPMWKWFAFLALGLVVIAVAGAIVDYFAGEDAIRSGQNAVTDTLS
jgi:phosphoglycerol transferase MdoB-like AlkP superfamily enzyme